MRQIKFRAKDANDEWVYGSLIINETENDKGKFTVAFIVPDLPCASDGDDFYTARMVRVKVETIGQLTSLRDINGKDIYEGDILDVNYADEESYLEVRFVRGVFAFLWNGDLDDEFPCNAPTHEWAKVIGNIYDNPELIKRH